MSLEEANSSTEQPLGRQADYAEVLEPEKVVREKDRRVELWGRIWGDEALAVAFYLVLDVRQRAMDTLRLVVVRNSEDLHRFDPQMEPAGFDLRLKEFHVQSSSLPQSLHKEVEEFFRDYMSEEASLSSLERSLQKEQQAVLEDWVESMADALIGNDTSRYQVCGRIVKQDSNTGEASSQSQGENDVETEEVDGVEEKQKTNQETVPVQIVTRPMKGVSAVELDKGMNIVARMIGERVSNLPEKWIDDGEDPPVSVPIQTPVRRIETNPSLPSEFKGVPSDYVRVVVDLAEGMTGEGFVYKQDQIRVSESSSDQKGPTDHIVQLIVSLVSLVLIALLLFWTIS